MTSVTRSKSSGSARSSQHREPVSGLKCHCTAACKCTCGSFTGCLHGTSSNDKSTDISKPFPGGIHRSAIYGTIDLTTGSARSCELNHCLPRQSRLLAITAIGRTKRKQLPGERLATSRGSTPRSPAKRGPERKGLASFDERRKWPSRDSGTERCCSPGLLRTSDCAVSWGRQCRRAGGRRAGARETVQPVPGSGDHTRSRAGPLIWAARFGRAPKRPSSLRGSPERAHDISENRHSISVTDVDVIYLACGPVNSRCQPRGRFRGA